VVPEVNPYGRGILIQPWRLLANPHVYTFVWLGFCGWASAAGLLRLGFCGWASAAGLLRLGFCSGLFGAVAGVLIADYWLAYLYRRGGANWYNITTTGWWDSRWYWSFTGG
jgi:nucleobase:cation symporter-1, NCS1 family